MHEVLPPEPLMRARTRKTEVEGMGRAGCLSRTTCRREIVGLVACPLEIVCMHVDVSRYMCTCICTMDGTGDLGEWMGDV
jgi:hypothetical protein